MRATISLPGNGFEEEAVAFGYPRERVFRQAARVRCGSILLQSRKSRGSEDLANVECWRSRRLQGSAESMGASVVAFGLIDEVPHIAARETYE